MKARSTSMGWAASASIIGIASMTLVAVLPMLNRPDVRARNAVASSWS